jgi:hypothetical protein
MHSAMRPLASQTIQYQTGITCHGQSEIDGKSKISAMLQQAWKRKTVADLTRKNHGRTKFLGLLSTDWQPANTWGIPKNRIEDFRSHKRLQR